MWNEICELKYEKWNMWNEICERNYINDVYEICEIKLSMRHEILWGNIVIEIYLYIYFHVLWHSTKVG